MQASGVILAGGRSSRMKFNKAFAEIGDQTVIQIILDKFARLFDETIIISNEPELFEPLGALVYPDVYPRLGPVSGVHSGLCYAQYERVFVLGCDMPFINMELVEYMLNILDNYDAVVPKIDSYLQPLATVYSHKCMPVLQAGLDNHRVKLIGIFEELKTRVLSRHELEKFGSVKEIFLNLNDVQALQLAIEIAGRY